MIRRSREIKAGTSTPRRWAIHGHAIVSANDCIADAAGAMPEALRNNADWRRFQSALDGAAVTALGRLSHQASPNVRRRDRLVVSSTARDIEQREDAWWWNPAEADVSDALARAAPDGGVVAVVGGRRVFDLFLQIGFDRFDLARATRVVLPGGVPIFSTVDEDVSAETVLAAELDSGPIQMLDADAAVTVTVWHRRPGGA